MDESLHHNLGFDLVRVTEITALAAGRWIGSGDREAVHRAATEAMARALNEVNLNGRVVIGEEGRLGELRLLDTGSKVGTGHGPQVDVALDPIDGTRSVARGRPGALSVASIAPRGSMWSPQPAVYMDKIVVDREVASYLVPECMDAPVGWTLALVARAKGKGQGLECSQGSFGSHPTKLLTAPVPNCWNKRNRSLEAFQDFRCRLFCHLVSLTTVVFITHTLGVIENHHHRALF